MVLMTYFKFSDAGNFLFEVQWLRNVNSWSNMINLEIDPQLLIDTIMGQDYGSAINKRSGKFRANPDIQMFMQILLDQLWDECEPVKFVAIRSGISLVKGAKESGQMTRRTKKNGGGALA
ncbi:hypothetical protein QQP08_019881 [Theobroma cacao]|nr:hypothetical protein QQP08_019881 [Theobroma cacao]